MYFFFNIFDISQYVLSFNNKRQVGVFIYICDIEKMEFFQCYFIYMIDKKIFFELYIRLGNIYNVWILKKI